MTSSLIRPPGTRAGAAKWKKPSTRTGDYVVITPARNEEEFLGETIRSMELQTLRPRRWIIVDDGSTDTTPEIAAEAGKKHDWIQVLNRQKRPDRQVGGGVVRAFEAGLEMVKDLDYRYLCKLDGDLKMGTRYFERLLEYFDRDPKMGTLSGKSYLASRWKSADFSARPEYTSNEFSLGAAKFYRRECFEAIGGFVKEVMWDGIDCHRCRQLGWKAASVDEPDLKIYHLRQMGSSHHNVFHGRMRHGRGQYFMGTHPLYMIASGLFRMKERPCVLGGIMMILGYFKAALAGARRYEDSAFRKHLHGWQMARLRSLILKR